MTTVIDGTAFVGAKLAAMGAHATQIAVDAPFFALSDNVGRRVLGTEHYTLLAGPLTPDPERAALGGRVVESDLFAGID